jgi:predicted amidohydrolase
VNVIALQLDIAWENKPANFATVRRLLSEAAPAQDSLVVLPEMFATGFSMNTGVIAEPRGGATEQFLASVAREFGICLVAGAAMLGRDGRVRNKALVFSPAGELLAFYAKMQLFTPGGEPKHYSAGERPTAFRWGDCTVSPFICYDLRFPRSFGGGHAPPELFTVIANFPRSGSSLGAAPQGRAIENQACGRRKPPGQDPYYTYAGRSVIDPQGEIAGRCRRARRLHLHAVGFGWLAQIS